MNGERYRDPTADKAIRNVDKKPQTPQQVMDVVNILRRIAYMAGFEIIGRIQLRDRWTGKEYR